MSEMDKEKVPNVTEKHIMVKLLPDGTAQVPTKDKDGQVLRLITTEGHSLEPEILAHQQIIEAPPIPKKGLYEKACSNDGVTITSWAKQWVDQCVENSKTHDFIEDSVAAVLGRELTKPVIIAGSGPSLKKNVKQLNPTPDRFMHPKLGTFWKDTFGRGDIKIVSCLHNFGMFEDMDVMGPDDFYLNLDAGEITIKEVYEGSKHDEEWCWERTKDRTLLAFTSSHPELIKKWRGKILWFTTSPNPATNEKLRDLIDFTKVPVFNVGGNALGACLYMARAILGCGPTILIGADFAFDGVHAFHGWDSPYDEQFSGVQPCVDIYGRKRFTWPSYFNFKCWFDFVACGGNGNNPKLFINCTEGGILGAYPEGNIKQIQQMSLKECLNMFNYPRNMPDVLKDSGEMVQLLF